MNVVIETIKDRRSIRKYKTEQLSEQELTYILEAGIHAPSGGNNQTSHLFVIQKPEILEKLKLLVEQEFGKMEIYEGMYKSLKGSILASKKGGYDFCYHAPTLIIVSNKQGYGNAIADCVCIIENMMIAATSLSVGSCYINQLRWLDENPIIRQYMYQLGLGEEETICGGVALGYSDSQELQPLQRTGNTITYIK
jgi:nitroreductase